MLGNNHQQQSSNWFEQLRNEICNIYEALEAEYSSVKNLTPGKFKRKAWEREGGGGGVMAIMHGNLFEKVGVNISTVYGQFSPEFRSQIPDCDDAGNFFATGISLVAHMNSPIIPAAHFNTRYIQTTKNWFGGGCDLTQAIEDKIEAARFHQDLANVCDVHDPSYYSRFKANCDEYFYLKHRKEMRGIGGIFFDYLNTGDFGHDFNFVKDIGIEFKESFANIIKDKMFMPWTNEQKEAQLIKRGRYVEFNLLYDRGIKFGLMTGGNIEAMFMSLPPIVKWL